MTENRAEGKLKPPGSRERDGGVFLVDGTNQPTVIMDRIFIVSAVSVSVVPASTAADWNVASHNSHCTAQVSRAEGGREETADLEETHCSVLTVTCHMENELQPCTGPLQGSITRRKWSVLSVHFGSQECATKHVCSEEFSAWRWMQCGQSPRTPVVWWLWTLPWALWF